MKLFVAGCSISDYDYNPQSNVQNVYGDYLSKLLNCEYVHESVGCGSNHRIWRKITNHIIDGNLTSDDLLLIQYTEKSRTEFFSNIPLKYGQEISNTMSEYYDKGRVIKFKVGESNNSARLTKENEFLNLYENYFLDKDFIDDEFNYHNFMFQHMLKNNGIKTIFIKHFYDGFGLIEPFGCNSFQIEYKILNDSRYRVSDIDYTHFSEKGHKLIGDMLFEHIKKINIL